jgi:hypothetical protein
MAAREVEVKAGGVGTVAVVIGILRPPSYRYL